MTSNTADRQVVGIAIAIFAVFVLLPVVMGFGMMGTGAMWDGTHHHGTWDSGDGQGWMVMVLLGQLLFLAVVVGLGYLGYRALTGEGQSTDPALEELRLAYARGDLSDEEFEQRRQRLETEE